MEGVSINPTRIGWVEAIRGDGRRRRGRRPEGGVGTAPVGSDPARGSRACGDWRSGASWSPGPSMRSRSFALPPCVRMGKTVIRDAAELRVKESDRTHRFAKSVPSSDSRSWSGRTDGDDGSTSASGVEFAIATAITGSQ